MNTPIEDRLQDDLRHSVADMGAPVFQADDVIRKGRSVRWHRTMYTGGAAVAGVAAVAALLAATLDRPVTPPEPAASQTATAGPSAGVTWPGPTSRGMYRDMVATLAADGTIRRGGHVAAYVPIPEDGRVVNATGVSGGWVVETAGPDAAAGHVTSFLTAAGQLRDFTPRLEGATVAFAPDGKAMAAYQYPYLHIYDLPSLTEHTRIDVRKNSHGNQLQDMWLREGRLAVSWRTAGGAHPGAINGLVAYDLDTDKATVTENADVADIAARGAAAVMHEGDNCLRVGRFNGPVSLDGTQTCFPGWEIRHVSLSPDGVDAAVFLNRPGAPADGAELRIIPTGNLAQGRSDAAATQTGRLRPVQWPHIAYLVAATDGPENGPSVVCGIAPPQCDEVTLLTIPQTVIADYAP
ncbi:hypothetical protein AB0B66_15200 [Catellatospora sp. NPDC049111]|uniref:hypothetical protein n=1 Tax=Catellatospora sp. NPDC049111 TaxID=3155271 RepID=UPI0033D78921